jgi:hypothetical protein
MVEGCESVSGMGEVGAGRGEGEMREGAIMGSRGWICSQRSKETVQAILRLDEWRRHYNAIIQALEQSV